MESKKEKKYTRLELFELQSTFVMKSRGEKGREMDRIVHGGVSSVCDSYSSWQKGSVENSNREFRWHHPKGTDFGALTPAGVRQTEEKINRKPMKCLHYLSPKELTEALIAA